MTHAPLSQAQILQLLELARLGTWSRDLVSGEVWWSDEFRALLGMGADEAATRASFLKRVHPDDRARIDRELDAAYTQDGDTTLTFRILRTGGEVLHFQSSIRIQRDETGGRPLALGIVQDITPQRQIEEELRRQTAYLTAIVNHLPQGITVFDNQLRLQYWNARFGEVTDVPPEALQRNARFEDLILYPALRGEYGPGDPEDLVRQRRALAARFKPHRLERTRPNGRTHLVEGEPLLIDGRTMGFITTYTDITEQKQAEASIAHLAHHDALTGLANRFSLYARLEQAIADARRHAQSLAVLFLDLDRFKNINDSLGHHMGDQLLMLVAQRLRATVREADIVARLGGDEFVIVLHSLKGAQSAAHVASKLLAALSAPYVLDTLDLHVTPSIGISLFPDDDEDATGLMRNADAAMYHAKALGRANFQFFTEELNRRITERLKLESRLRGAIARNELALWYQPKIAAHDGRIVGVEALLRWHHPDGGLVAPSSFIPIAEETGLIVDIGTWVICQACRQAQAWQSRGIAPLGVSVNLSTRQIRDAGLLTTVTETLQHTGLDPALLELEITESTVMERPDTAIELLRALKALGLKIAVDDFGTGHSSLSYLKLLPLDRLKIDRSFVSDLERDPNDAAIVAAAVSLAHNLGLSVTAEGVETATQVERLRALGCDELQGYHFSRPITADEFEAFYLAYRPQP